MLKFVTKQPKMAKRAKIWRFLCSKGHWLEKSTLTPVVAVVTNIRYGQVFNHISIPNKHNFGTTSGSFLNFQPHGLNLTLT